MTRRYHDAFDYDESDRNYDMRSIRLRYDCVEKLTGQVLPSAKYRPTHVVVDAALERADTAVTKLQISPLIVNGFKNGFHQWIQRIFLVIMEAQENFFLKFFFWFLKFGCTLPPYSG